MGRAEQRLYTVGRFWLAKRAQSPFYQIRWYDEASQTTRNQSTRCQSLLDAQRAIHAHAEQDLLEQLQPVEQAAVVPLLLRYWDEHGKTTWNPKAIDGSLRTFAAFLDQDRVGIDATVAAMKPDVFKRFQAWRMKPHSWAIDWRGKHHAHQSQGVTGETVQRNLDDIRAALNHSANMGRIELAPKVKSVKSDLRSPARDVKLTIDQLGAIVGYAAYDLDALRWILGMVATGARPQAVLLWEPAKQWGERGANFDTNPPGRARTKKRNAVVPIIPEFRPWLEAWADHPSATVKSRRTWWRTMRAALGLPPEVVAKTIRHTVATELRGRGVPLDEIAGLLGHLGDRRITAGYAKYDPSRLPHAKRELSALWQDVCRAAQKFLSNHVRVSPCRGRDLEVVQKAAKV